MNIGVNSVMNATVNAALAWGRALAIDDDNPYEPVTGNLLDGSAFEVWVLIVVTVLVLILGSLAAGAGIGGGGLFVPMFAFILGVGAKAAVPMSKAMILGGSIGNLLSIAVARHPDPEKNKPLIDYEAVALMQSGELLGSVFGVWLNLLLPEIIIIVFLAVLLTFNAYKTFAKGLSKYKAETTKIRRSMEVSNPKEASKPQDVSPAPENSAEFECLDFSMDAVPGEQVSVEQIQLKDDDSGSGSGSGSGKGSGDESTKTGSGSGSGPAEPSTPEMQNDKDTWQRPTSGTEHEKAKEEASAGDATPGMKDGNSQVPVSPELEKVLQAEAVQFPLWAWTLLPLMTGYTIIYAIIKKDHMDTCNPVSYWLWYFSPLAVLGGFCFSAGLVLKKTHARRVQAGYKFKGDGEENPEYRDMQWDNRTLRKFPSVAVLAGVAAGLLGIGGGMVICPLFMQFDMQPRVSTSSCAFMIFWTAISGVVQYALSGKIGWQFVLYGIFVGFLSGQLGQRGVDHMLRKSGRPSYVVLLLGAIILVACVSMTGTGTFKLIKGVADGDDIFKFDTKDLECSD